jgi:tRNA(Ile2) C34 agmatinyltransferase TiaS
MPTISKFPKCRSATSSSILRIKRVYQEHICIDCGEKTQRRSERCQKCAVKHRKLYKNEYMREYSEKKHYSNKSAQQHISQEEFIKNVRKIFVL